MPSFKEATGRVINDKEEQGTGEVTASKAASAFLAAHSVKDARLSVRISSTMLSQFNEINRKLGATNGSVVNTLVARYILDNKDLLD